MNIRSIDLQVLIPHATDASKVQSVQNQQNNIEQHHFAQQFNELMSERREQVQGTSKTEGSKVTREKENKNTGQYSNQQNNNNKDDRKDKKEKSIIDAPQPSDPLRGHVIDIKL